MRHNVSLSLQGRRAGAPAGGEGVVGPPIQVERREQRRRRRRHRDLVTAEMISNGRSSPRSSSREGKGNPTNPIIGLVSLFHQEQKFQEDETVVCGCSVNCCAVSVSVSVSCCATRKKKVPQSKGVCGMLEKQEIVTSSSGISDTRSSPNVLLSPALPLLLLHDIKHFPFCPRDMECKPSPQHPTRARTYLFSSGSAVGKKVGCAMSAIVLDRRTWPAIGSGSGYRIQAAAAAAAGLLLVLVSVR